MKAKFVIAICLFVMGSVFSLSYTIYCDLWMSHQTAAVAHQGAKSCHEVPESSPQKSPAACPILLNLSDGQALTTKDSLRIEKQFSAAIFYANSSLLVPPASSSMVARFDLQRPQESVPLYLRNPVLRI